MFRSPRLICDTLLNRAIFLAKLTSSLRCSSAFTLTTILRQGPCTYHGLTRKSGEISAVIKAWHSWHKIHTHVERLAKCSFNDILEVTQDRKAWPQMSGRCHTTQSHRQEALRVLLNLTAITTECRRHLSQASTCGPQDERDTWYLPGPLEAGEGLPHDR